MRCDARLHLRVGTLDGQESGGLFIRCDDHNEETGRHVAHLAQPAMGIVLASGIEIVSWGEE